MGKKPYRERNGVARVPSRAKQLSLWLSKRQPRRRSTARGPRASARDRQWAAVFQLLPGEGEAAEQAYGHLLGRRSPADSI